MPGVQLTHRDVSLKNIIRAHNTSEYCLIDFELVNLAPREYDYAVLYVNLLKTNNEQACNIIKEFITSHQELKEEVFWQCVLYRLSLNIPL